MSGGRKCRVSGCDRKSAKQSALCPAHARRKDRGQKEGSAEFAAPIMTREERAEYIHKKFLPPPVAISRELEISYDDEWTRFRKWLGIRRKRRHRLKPPAKNKVQRIGVIADLHVPFHDPDALAQAVEWLGSKKAAELWIAGDLCDCYSLSKFVQYEHVPIQREFVETRKILDWLSREFAEVNIIEGNHEARERKYLFSRLPSDIADWVIQEGMLARCAKDMPNVQIIKRRVFDTDLNWLTQIGKDCIIGHPERMSKIPLRPVEWFRDWLSKWDETLELPRPRLVIAGHTHQAGNAWIGRVQICECGSMCLPQGYALTPKMYDKPQIQGALYFEQRDGLTERNSLRQFYPRPAAAR